MNKEIFLWILECALLAWDGVTYQELITKYGADPKEVKAGIQLCEYLRKIKLPEEQEDFEK